MAKLLNAAMIAGAALSAIGAPAVAQTYQQSVAAANPTANFRLTNPATGSTVNGYTTTWQNSVATGAGAPLAADPGNTGAVFDGVNNATPGIITTSLSGHLPGAGTVLAWVKLAALPGTSGSTYYVAGESEYGNDFDLQFASDNTLRFYTGAGENTAYAADTATLAGQWHFIAATYDSTLGASSFRNIYWDGALGQGYTGTVNSATKSAAFTIGYSSLFGGRELNGSIDEVTVYDHALTADQIAGIYASRLNGVVTAGVPEPASWATMIAGFALLGPAMRRRATRRLVTA